MLHCFRFLPYYLHVFDDPDWVTPFACDDSFACVAFRCILTVKVKWAHTCKCYMLYTVCIHTHVQDTVHLSNNGPVTSVKMRSFQLVLTLRGNAAFSLQEPWCLGSLPGDNAVWLWPPHESPAKSSVKLSYTCTHTLTHIHTHFVNQKVDSPLTPAPNPSFFFLSTSHQAEYPHLACLCPLS